MATTEPTSENLYEINDALTVLMGRFDVYAGLEDDEVYQMLQDATMAVAGFFWPDAERS